MSEAVEKITDKALSNVDKVTDFAVTQVNAIIEGVKSMTPGVANTILNVTQLTALSHVFVGLLMAVISYVLYRLTRYWWPKAVNWSNKNYNKPYAEKYDGPPPEIGVFLFGIFSFLTGFCSFIHLISFWTWVGLFRPEIYLAHEVIQRVLNSK